MGFCGVISSIFPCVFMLPFDYLARKSCIRFVICLDSDSRFILVWISVFVRL
jgi:hypothetical protein